MAAEMLNKVLAKENEANAGEENAKSKADETVKNAKADAEKLLNDTVRLCDEREKDEIARAAALAQKSLAESEDSAKKYADGLIKTSELKFSEAVGLVKEIISH